MTNEQRRRGHRQDSNPGPPRPFLGVRTVLDVGGGNGRLARPVHGLNETAAANTAATLDLPLVLTKRGCLVYATKAARTTQARV